jgi:hypothetical protein
MTLIHYSSSQHLQVVDADTRRRGSDRGAVRDPFYKPVGLWVSVEGPDDWKSWCESESFSLDRLKYEHRVILSPSANVLVLSGAGEIKAFTAQYGITARYPGDAAIDWPRVSREFDGLIIAPYCWQCRFSDETFWYYGWDCASGCIWRARAIESVLPARETVLSVRQDEDAVRETR